MATHAPTRASQGQLAALSAIMANAQADIGRRIDGISASYRAAERHRLSDSRSRHLRGVAGTLDSHLRQSDRDELIARSRDAWQNYPVARSMIEQHVGLIVGDGFTPQPDTGSDGVDRAIAQLWHEWAESPEVTGRWDYDGMTEAALRHAALDGATVVVPTELGLTQIVGAQRLRSPAGTWDSLEWRGGVRVGEHGQPLEMNIVEWQSDGRSVRQTAGRRLPMGRNYESPFLLVHSKLEDQYVGEPLLAPVLEDLGQMQDLMESVDQAAHMAALLAFVHTTMDPSGTAGMLGAQDQTDPVSSQTRKVAPTGDSGVHTLLPGEDLKAVQGTQPTQNYGDMLRLKIRLLGAAVCLPLELAMLDFSQSNFHGALAAVEVAVREAERRQAWLVNRLHKRLYRWKVGEWADDGLLGGAAQAMDAASLYRCEWRYPRPLVVDPKRAAEVFQIMRKMGAMPLRDLRPDWVEVFQQLAREQAKAAELGVVIEMTPGSHSAAAAVQDADAGQGEDARSQDGQSTGVRLVSE